MRVLVACEFSGRVRDAFTAKGHYAVSCDLLPSETHGNHYPGDVRDIIDLHWDLLIAHPPCQHLTVTGARWWKDKPAHLQAEALDFVRWLLARPIPKICLENPIGKISTAVRKPDQIIQPWQFGHGEVKGTCLWLKGLPLLQPSQIVDGREPKSWLMPGDKNQAKNRSRTYPGIAQAMAEQWG